METTGKFGQVMRVGPTPANDDPTQAMIERMTMIEIEAAVKWRTQLEWAKSIAHLTTPRNNVAVTRHICEHTASHYTLAFVDPRYHWRIRPNINMLSAIGRAVADAMAADDAMRAMERAAMEEKAANHPTMQ